ncbi:MULTISPECIES: spore germination protein [Clostridium]|uniref:GerABKA family spore germination protein n=2 Tax=Clostridium intestinale TaxID=36845 RepID=U2NKB8_9CLOT|nr:MULTISPECIES: spore germination protein [Clostridium]ERK29563.1 GerABKA family spore germination protein [Clostridium intestinale URNW]QLY80872.1 spore germination protein [Clostridium intestinale]
MNNYLDQLKKMFENAFDVKYREIDTPLGKATLVFIDVLCSSAFISEYIVTPLTYKNYQVKNTDDILKQVIRMNLAGTVKDIEDAQMHILMGDVVIVFDNNQSMIYCETKGYVRRGIGVPLTEAVVKGPREGFSEAFVDNVALIRRRVKNANLKLEPLILGKESNTSVCIAYLKGVAPDNLVQKVKDKIKESNYNFLLDTNYIENTLTENRSLFDTIGYTEKPDEISAKIMEGRVAIIVDGTPFVVTVPYFFVENFQTPDDYYLNRYFANFTRILRWSAFFIAMFLPALYVAFITYHFGMIPTMFIFRMAVARAGVPFPTFIEVILMMLFFQLIKEAGLRLPQPIGSAMSIVSALILGEAAVGAGLASRVTILVVAISTLSYFLIPKTYGAISLWSIILVIVASLFGIPGFIIGSMILTSHLASLQSCGYSFLFPLGSIRRYGFRDVILRGNLEDISKDVIKDEEE